MAKQKLSDEMKKYGYVFSLKKSLISFAAMFTFMFLLGRFFGLLNAALFILMAAGAFLLPFFLRNTYKNRYYQKKFSDLNIYMEQFLYSFQKTGKILMTLKDVATLFEDKGMRLVIEDAIYYIEHTYDERNVTEKGLAIIEKEYNCEGLVTMHGFALWTEEFGGEYSGSVTILLESRRMWADRVYKLMQMKRKKRSDIVLSIIASLALCMGIYYMSRKMGVDVSESPVAQAVTVVVLIMDMFIYYLADRKLVGGYFDEDEKLMGEKEAQEAYERYYGYKDTVLGRMAKRSLKKRLTRETEKCFPRWLMQLSLLLQTENVDVAILNSYKQAPCVIRPPLLRLIGALKKDPSGRDAYLNFLSDFNLPEVGSAMKMLYSISEGSGGDSGEQIKDMIRRNRQLTDKAKQLSGEDAVAGMYALFLAPQLTGGAKIMVDMLLIFTVYMSRMA
ncbi:MAG: hypothetical protein K6F00_06185 [Lachnospiraceae bacterium]|nr:hypothetical protein [Lachnospiraceae bacterium]